VGWARPPPGGPRLAAPAPTTGTLAASVGAAVVAYERGATVLRVHDVRETVEALAVASAVGR
jgi:dihydropteroate synthase